MRIIYLADIRFPLERANGIQTFQTCLALARRGHAVTLVARPDTVRPARDPFVFYGARPDVRLTIARATVVGPAPVRRVCYVGQAAGRAARRSTFDVVFTRDLALAALLTKLPRAWRPPVVYEAHGFAPVVAASMGDLLTGGRNASAARQRRLTRRERAVWRRADGYVTITRALAGELASRFGSRPDVAVVPDGTTILQMDNPQTGGVEWNERDFLFARGTRTPVVGYAGHLYPWKGVDVLLEALARVDDVRGLIIGGVAAEADLDRLRKRAREMGIASRVEFTGAVAPAEVGRLLARADVLALPNTATAISSLYTSPLKLFEYMAAGRPIVASDLPALREVLQDGETALLVPPGDPDALAAAIRRLVGDEALARRLALAARREVTAYGWERRAERLEDVLQAAIDAARTPTPTSQGHHA